MYTLIRIVIHSAPYLLYHPPHAASSFCINHPHARFGQKSAVLAEISAVLVEKSASTADFRRKHTAPSASETDLRAVRFPTLTYQL